MMASQSNDWDEKSLQRLAIEQLKPGLVIADRFVLTGGVIGYGGMGLVLRAKQIEFNRPCVIKVLAPHLHPRFRPDLADIPLNAEADTLVELTNEGGAYFVQVYGRGVISLNIPGQEELGPLELPFFAMEMLKGMTFERLIARQRDELREPLSWKLVLTLSHEVASALCVAHALGIIHRDLKPDNVFLCRTSHGHGVKVIDLGIARRKGQILLVGSGTSRYAAPELLKGGGGQEDLPSDVYALGLLIFELATLRGPFDGMARSMVPWAHSFEKPPSISDLRPDAPNALVDLVSSMLQKEPASRPTAQACADLLHELLFAAIEDVRDSQLGNLLQAARPTETVRIKEARLSHDSSNGDEPLFESEPLIQRAASAEPVGVPTLRRPTPLKYADTEPDAEPFGATAASAERTEPLTAFRLFRSTGEMFESVWEDDTRYVSSPLAQPSAPPMPRAVETTAPLAPSSSVHPARVEITLEPVADPPHESAFPNHPPPPLWPWVAAGSFIAILAVSLVSRRASWPLVQTSNTREAAASAEARPLSSGTSPKDSAAVLAGPPDASSAETERTEAVLDGGAPHPMPHATVVRPYGTFFQTKRDPRHDGHSPSTPEPQPHVDGRPPSPEPQHDEPSAPTRDASTLDDLNVDLRH